MTDATSLTLALAALGGNEQALSEAKDYTDTRIDSIIPGFNYKGSVATVGDLPSTGNTKGDCYNVEDGSGVYAWDGDSWGSASKVGPQGPQGATGPQGPKGEDGSNSVSVSATGTSTNEVGYITIDGVESKLSGMTTLERTALDSAIANGGIGWTEGGGGSATVIEWNGDITGKATSYIQGMTITVISDELPSEAELIGGQVRYTGSESFVINMNADNVQSWEDIMGSIPQGGSADDRLICTDDDSIMAYVLHNDVTIVVEGETYNYPAGFSVFGYAEDETATQMEEYVSYVRYGNGIESIEWDGTVIEGKPVIGGMAYWVQEDFPSDFLTAFDGQTVTAIMGGEEMTMNLNVPGCVARTGETNSYQLINGDPNDPDIYGFIATADTVISGDTVVKGIYLLKVDDNYVSKVNYTTGGGSATVHKIDGDYIPISVSASGTSTNEVGYITIDGVESKLAGGSEVSVSSTGTSTSDVRYITIDGVESRFTSVALKAMKSAWVTGTTQAAATAILNDDSVVAGDGFLSTVYWSDLPGDITQAEVKAFVMKKGTSYQKIIQFECTSGTVAPYAWFYNSYDSAHIWRTYVPLENTVTSTSTTSALTANMGKSLQDEINNLKNIGRFLSIWNASTGAPSSEPTASPYSYKVGDYYRVGTAGTKNPAGNSTYTTGGTNWVEGDSLGVGDVVYVSNIEGTTATWVKQTSGGGGTVQDVQVNGTSIVASGTGIANITDGALSEVKYSAQTLTDAQKSQARTNIAAIALEEYNSSATSYEENVLYYVVED